MKELSTEGAQFADSPSEAASEADVTILSLLSPEVEESVLLASDKVHEAFLGRANNGRLEGDEKATVTFMVGGERIYLRHNDVGLMIETVSSLHLHILTPQAVRDALQPLQHNLGNVDSCLPKEDIDAVWDIENIFRIDAMHVMIGVWDRASISLDNRS